MESTRTLRESTRLSVSEICSLTFALYHTGSRLSLPLESTCQPSESTRVLRESTRLSESKMASLSFCLLLHRVDSYNAEVDSASIRVDSRSSGVDSLTGFELDLSVRLSVLSRSRLVMYRSRLELEPVLLIRLESTRNLPKSTRVSDFGSN